MTVARGRLASAGDVPPAGERVDELCEFGNVRIEQILSGADVRAQAYDQAEDEWVVVLEGSATLNIDGEVVELGEGEWVALPAHTPHTLVEVAAGTRWLAVHHAPTS